MSNKRTILKSLVESYDFKKELEEALESVSKYNLSDIDIVKENPDALFFKRRFKKIINSLKRIYKSELFLHELLEKKFIKLFKKQLKKQDAMCIVTMNRIDSIVKFLEEWRLRDEVMEFVYTFNIILLKKVKDIYINNNNFIINFIRKYKTTQLELNMNFKLSEIKVRSLEREEEEEYE